MQNKSIYEILMEEALLTHLAYMNRDFRERPMLPVNVARRWLENYGHFFADKIAPTGIVLAEQMAETKENAEQKLLHEIHATLHKKEFHFSEDVAYHLDQMIKTGRRYLDSFGNSDFSL